MICAWGQVASLRTTQHERLAKQKEVQLVGERASRGDLACCARIHSVTAGPYLRQKRLR